MINHLKTLRLAIAVTFFLSTIGIAPPVQAQDTGSQVINNAYAYTNANPAYSQGEGPRITVHRAVSPYVERGSFDAFGVLSRSDGFQLIWLDAPLSEEALGNSEVFVVANAYTKGGDLDYRNFGTLDAPSVYNDDEIAMLIDWVENGGSLLVLADHSPFAGGTIKLAETLGFTYMTGSAVHRSSVVGDIIADIEFRKDGTTGFRIGKLADHPITNGGLGREPLESFYTFSGQAIIPPADANNLLTMPSNFETVLTYSLRRDFNTAPRIDTSGFSQGAVVERGQGRIAVFGETGAFTSQILHGSIGMGLGSERAPKNEEFVLSVLRWLARYEPE